MSDLQIPDWTPELSVGHPKLDAQHQELVVLGQRALALLQAPPALPGQFHQLLNDIADAMRRHFETEEAVLKEHGCPMLSEHRAQHDRYLERLTDLLYRGANGIPDPDGLALLIRELIVGHVVEDDLPLKAYMQKNGQH